MVKRLFNIALVVALFSSVAMAQERSEDVVVEGPDTVAAEAGPVAGSMQGPDTMMLKQGPDDPAAPGQRVFNLRVRDPMGPGGMMWFRGRGMGEWWTSPRVAEELGLSDQQKQQLEKISQDGRLKMIDLRADLEKQEVVLGPMLRTFHPDEAQVLAQVEKVSQARAALEKERIQTMLESRGVLTEEQWKKLEDTRAEFHQNFRRRSLPRPARPGTPSTPPTPPTPPESK
ncbi:MAG TPA: Spy/CpxP family protein refolding chaperone [Terriglobia bacterium]|nr:Spy/CpxP family protein refolding chaperone [Terriglobia bacterium]